MESNPTVFIVDGDPLSRASVRDLVSMMNFRWQEYDSGREFLQSYDENCAGCLVTGDHSFGVRSGRDDG